MMPDREKTIEGLEHCSDRSNMMCNRTCPYYDSIFCEAELAGDALAMLKEQEDASKRNPVIICPHCGKRVK